MMSYLKPDDVRNAPLNFKFLARADSATEKQSQAGKTYEVIEYTFKVLSTGMLKTENIFAGSFDSKKLMEAKEGDVCQAYLSVGKDGKEYVNWKVVDSPSEPQVGPSAASDNYKEVKQEQTYTKTQDDRTRSILYQAFGKSFIESGMRDAVEIDGFIRKMIDNHDKFLSE